MMNFFGAGGGGGGACIAAELSAGGAVLSCDAGGGAWFPAVICPPLESSWAWALLARSCALLDFFSLSLSLSLSLLGRAASAGGALASCVFIGACAGSSAIALGFPSLLTCRLLMTVFTPATDAACFPAASRCVSLSTVPDKVTTPLSVCTATCLVDR